MVDFNKLKTSGIVALHPEGVDRNFEGGDEPEGEEVALHPEGVDRNNLSVGGICGLRVVALHPEGVDRNTFFRLFGLVLRLVALHPEGADRNCRNWQYGVGKWGRPPPGGRG